MTTRYVLCVAVWCGKVCLLLKQHPAWQKNKFNFPGGKLEGDETPAQACVREWKEETGCFTKEDSWKYKGRLFGKTGSGFEVFVFLTGDVEPCMTSTQTDEIISWHSMDAMPSNCMDNLDDIMRGCCRSSFEIEYK